LSKLPGDIELWNAFKEGDRDAFGTLFKRHYSLLYQYGVKINPDTDVVEDCIQELFVELWHNKSAATVQSVKAYLLTSLKYKLFKISRDTLSRLAKDEENIAFDISYENNMEAREDANLQTVSIITALNQLPPRQKEIVYLKIFHGFSYEELSEIMNINYQVCRNLFSQSIKSLRKLLDSPD
jgi:RNA polymerase sigma-70 factor (ECF subfamily)